MNVSPKGDAQWGQDNKGGFGLLSIITSALFIMEQQLLQTMSKHFYFIYMFPAQMVCIRGMIRVSFARVKSELLHSGDDVPELRLGGEIYGIRCPAGVSPWISGNPQELLPDSELLPLHNPSGSLPGGINNSEDVHEGGLACWKETLKLILKFGFCPQPTHPVQLPICKPASNRSLRYLSLYSKACEHKKMNITVSLTCFFL